MCWFLLLSFLFDFFLRPSNIGFKKRKQKKKKIFFTIYQKKTKTFEVMIELDDESELRRIISILRRRRCCSGIAWYERHTRHLSDRTVFVFNFLLPWQNNQIIIFFNTHNLPCLSHWHSNIFIFLLSFLRSITFCVILILFSQSRLLWMSCITQPYWTGENSI